MIDYWNILGLITAICLGAMVVIFTTVTLIGLISAFHEQRQAKRRLKAQQNVSVFGPRNHLYAVDKD